MIDEIFALNGKLRLKIENLIFLEFSLDINDFLIKLKTLKFSVNRIRKIKTPEKSSHYLIPYFNFPRTISLGWTPSGVLGSNSLPRQKNVSTRYHGPVFYYIIYHKMTNILLDFDNILLDIDNILPDSGNMLLEIGNILPDQY